MYSWVNLTNVLWVEYPLGLGFSTTENVTAMSEEETAADFVEFFKNFQDIFGISNYKIYVTGESCEYRYQHLMYKGLTLTTRCGPVRIETRSRGQAKEALFNVKNMGSSALREVMRSLEMSSVFPGISLDSMSKNRRFCFSWRERDHQAFANQISAMSLTSPPL